MSYTDCCDWSECKACGICLSRCPVMGMGKEEARTEMRALLEGGSAKRVSRECTLCFRCNSACPKGLRPYELILGRVTERRDSEGTVPALVPYMLNGPRPNFFRDVYSEMSDDERRILERWGEVPAPSDEVLFVGCTGRMFCRDIEESRVLAGIPRYGPADVCCGELHYRAGLWGAFSRTADGALESLSRLETGRLVSYCESCTAFLRNMIPQVYGRKLPFEVVSLFEWLLERVESGALSLVEPIGRMALHESCGCADLGEGFYDTMRAVLEAAGADVVELDHNRLGGISCGAASVARRFKLRDVLHEQRKKYRDVRRSGARDLAVNCPGCYFTLSPTSRLRRVRLHYLAEELLHAFGDDITVPIAGRASLVNRVLAKNVPRMVGRRSDALALKGE